MSIFLKLMINFMLLKNDFIYAKIYSVFIPKHLTKFIKHLLTFKKFLVKRSLLFLNV